ncbi:hypothetical protein [Dysgonomonas termitidis]|uniref:Uncharacterized protein n=1 Tax=Dysgonomonas termitidis TaxID=1516126 RepID=A0ABV9KZB3_9BACT
MKIRFEIVTQLYIKAFLKSDSNQIEIAHSGVLNDGFQNLLTSLFHIYHFVNEKQESFFPYNSCIKWEDDFIEYLWSISMSSIDSSIQFKIIKTSTGNPNYKETLWDNMVVFNDLFDNIFLSLDNIYKDFGLIGYKRIWEVGNFPVCEYLLLKANRENYILNEMETNEENEWKHKIHRENELFLLK